MLAKGSPTYFRFPHLSYLISALLDCWNFLAFSTRDVDDCCLLQARNWRQIPEAPCSSSLARQKGENIEGGVRRREKKLIHRFFTRQSSLSRAHRKFAHNTGGLSGGFHNLNRFLTRLLGARFPFRYRERRVPIKFLCGVCVGWQPHTASHTSANFGQSKRYRNDENRRKAEVETPQREHFGIVRENYKRVRSQKCS